MCALTSAESVENAASAIVKIWTANPDYKMKDLTLQQYQGQQARLKKLLDDIETLDERLTPLRNERDDLMKVLNTNTTRARSGIRGYFGADSTEYELAGGTRASERKKPAAKKTAAAK